MRGMGLCVDGGSDTSSTFIEVKSPFTFTIEDTSGYGKYERGGYAQQVKQPKELRFKSLAEASEDPEFVLTDFAKFDRPPQLHLGFRALDAFVAEHGGALPAAGSVSDAEEVVRLAKEANAAAADGALPTKPNRLLVSSTTPSGRFARKGTRGTPL